MRDAVMVIIRREERFLFVRRAPGRLAAGMWCPVSGKVEPGETQPEAVVREAFEETGLHVRAGAKVAESEGVDAPFRLHWWTAEILDGEARVACDEISELRWLTLGEIEALEPAFEADKEFFRLNSALLNRPCPG